MHGIAGTGKTFLSLYLALEEVLDPSTVYDDIFIVSVIVIVVVAAATTTITITLTIPSTTTTTTTTTTLHDNRKRTQI